MRELFFPNFSFSDFPRVRLYFFSNFSCIYMQFSEDYGPETNGKLNTKSRKRKAAVEKAPTKGNDVKDKKKEGRDIEEDVNRDPDTKTTPESCEFVKIFPPEIRIS